MVGNGEAVGGACLRAGGDPRWIEMRYLDEMRCGEAAAAAKVRVVVSVMNEWVMLVLMPYVFES